MTAPKNHEGVDWADLDDAKFERYASERFIAPDGSLEYWKEVSEVQWMRSFRRERDLEQKLSDARAALIAMRFYAPERAASEAACAGCAKVARHPGEGYVCLAHPAAAAKACTNFSPPEFSGRWQDWHRGHGCDRDDGKPRTAEGAAEIASIGVKP